MEWLPKVKGSGGPDLTQSIMPETTDELISDPLCD